MDKLIFIVGGFLLILYRILPGAFRIRVCLLVAGAALVLGAFLFPVGFFGEWNAVSEIENRRIVSIDLHPSELKYKVNLMDLAKVITDSTVINHIVTLLKHANVYFSGHSPTIWQEKMILRTNENDSLVIELDKRVNQGMGIYINNKVYRSDTLAHYLEILTNHISPK